MSVASPSAALASSHRPARHSSSARRSARSRRVPRAPRLASTVVLCTAARRAASRSPAHISRAVEREARRRCSTTARAGAGAAGAQARYVVGASAERGLVEGKRAFALRDQLRVGEAVRDLSGRPRGLDRAHAVARDPVPVLREPDQRLPAHARRRRSPRGRRGGFRTSTARFAISASARTSSARPRTIGGSSSASKGSRRSRAAANSPCPRGAQPPRSAAPGARRRPRVTPSDSSRARRPLEARRGPPRHPPHPRRPRRLRIRLAPRRAPRGGRAPRRSRRGAPAARAARGRVARRDPEVDGRGEQRMREGDAARRRGRAPPRPRPARRAVLPARHPRARRRRSHEVGRSSALTDLEQRLERGRQARDHALGDHLLERAREPRAGGRSGDRGPSRRANSIANIGLPPEAAWIASERRPRQVHAEPRPQDDVAGRRS